MRAIRAMLLACMTVHPYAAAFGQDSPLAQARAARSAGRTADAERLLAITLRNDPENYLALYNMGLIYEARAVRTPAGARQLQHYRTAVEWLERALRSPQRNAAGADRYTIFNSLGAMYLGLGNLERANLHLQEGWRNRDRLSDTSRGQLFGNLGYLYALQGDTRRARQSFAEGARLGNAFAQENLRRLGQAGAR